MALVIESIYSIIILLCCFSIFYKTNKFYSLTGHKGIGLFKNAFLYFGLGFFVRYVIILFNYTTGGIGIISVFSVPLNILFLYFLSMAGFSLVSSLIWGNIDRKRILAFHVIALGLGIVDTFFNMNFMFITQLLVLAYAISITYFNYQGSKSIGKKNFSQLYLIALILAFLGYLFNFLSVYILIGFFQYIVYGVTLITFLTFLYGVNKWQGSGKD